MIKKIIFILFIGVSLNLFSQDSTFVKFVYAGSQLIIPEGDVWTLDRVFISEGSSYSIKINETNFKEKYHSTDTLKVPYYLAEMELLSNKAMVRYQFYFKK